MIAITGLLRATGHLLTFFRLQMIVNQRTMIENTKEKGGFSSSSTAPILDYDASIVRKS